MPPRKVGPMSQSQPLPPFIDSVHAAELLGVSTDTVLDWVQAGRLSALGGKASNPFLRSADIQALAAELGLETQADGKKRVKSASAKVQTRLTADARWSDVSPEEIRDWASRADTARRQAARKAAETAMERLQQVLGELQN